MRRPQSGAGKDGSTRQNGAGGGQAGDGSTDPSHATPITEFFTPAQ
jgi:hypothetical protein